MEVKPEAIILDATAGNRTMWDKKEDPRILFIDVESDLSVKPDLIIDCTSTGFPNNSFNIIFFDPPHSYGRTKNTGVHQTPNYDIQKQRGWHTGAYYGFDKFSTKRALIVFMHKAQKEFYRIIKPNGVLWFKWSEIHSTLDAVLPLFDKWELIMKFEVAYQRRVKGNTTWWVMMMPILKDGGQKDGDAE